jgi:hypothetical protein
MSNRAGVLVETGTADSSWTPGVTPIFGSLLIFIVFCVVYGGLKKILREFDQNYIQIIERSEDEIRTIMKSHNNPRPFQGKSIIK